MSEFADFWNHICFNCGQTVKRIHRHHVSYFPEFTVQLCGNCHYGLIRYPLEKRSYLVRYTQEEYREFYGKNVYGLKDSVLRRASLLLRRGLSVSKPKRKPTIGGMCDAVLRDSARLSHLSEMEEKVRMAPKHTEYDYHSSLDFRCVEVFKLGEDPFFEDDGEHMIRYGVPMVTVYYIPSEHWGRLEWTRPGHYGYSDSFELWKGNPLLDAVKEAANPDRFGRIRRLIDDIEV